MVDVHLVVLVHGLWGNKTHFDYINSQIEEFKSQNKQTNDQEELVVYRTQGNEGYKTLDGIDVCGLRVAHEIIEQINIITKKVDQQVNKISIIGYSLGGLISRYAVGILYHQNYFKLIKPINFITFCTPHVGVLTPGSNISVRFFNTIVPKLISLSGKQMFLKDKSGSNEHPLLYSMAQPNSVFFKALSEFKYLSLYANTINDRRTSWWTAGISICDPFINIDENSSLNDLNYNYIDAYEPIILDANSKIIISNRTINKELIPPTTEEIVQNFWIRKSKWIIVLFNMLIFAPLWVIGFIISGVMESFKSHRRINLTLRENSNFLSSITDLIIEEEGEDEASEEDEDDALSELDFRTPAESIHSLDKNFNFQEFDYNVNSALHDQADNLMESVWDAMTSKDQIKSAQLSLAYDLKHDKSDTNIDVISTDDNDNVPGLKSTINELSYFDKDSEFYKIDALKPFIINLNDDQLEIIKNLNSLKWSKFPLLIRHTKSTHSASIVRDLNDKTLFEGKVVIKHWIENVFKLE
ncbi:putative lipase [Wickerhamomyces ciferrii]|uniref:Lipase n=1 Tax=Wickerhamomyces ciferrii (strain ATCC 14091 / BCRC 22168 / CBS 111 / JCM 3599 / NBRC 0793 / NRRL Y-1031 F-60-10) TaxID=1206466 RepID=K0KKY3_WICCF|nr:putative lipase [Wickerhamomyces ciferrii]CCH42114.1 putative lipase [Wickerhamomyces ciferrii]